MALLEWSDALALHVPCMDDTHREFVDLLAAVEAASDADLVPAWCRLVTHTEAHFGQEDRWMQATRFAAVNCHSMQHKAVLDAMREGTVRGAAGNVPWLRGLAAELAPWFVQHAQSMDAALALHMRRVAFDPVSGLVASPQALPATLISGCGGDSCSDLPLAAPAAATA
jgi:hemerythrin-like metal-binding protein